MKQKRRNLKPKLRLELTLYGNRDIIIKNLKDAVSYIEANVSPTEQLLYRSQGIDYDLTVRQLTPEDWFPGKKEKIIKDKQPALKGNKMKLSTKQKELLNALRNGCRIYSGGNGRPGNTNYSTGLRYTDGKGIGGKVRNETVLKLKELGLIEIECVRFKNIYTVTELGKTIIL